MVSKIAHTGGAAAIPRAWMPTCVVRASSIQAPATDMTAVTKVLGNIATGAEATGVLDIDRIPDLSGLYAPIAELGSFFMDLFTSSALLVAGDSVASAWFDFETLRVNSLRIVHTRTGGTYVFEVDWSVDGINVAVTEQIQGAGQNDTSVSKTVATRYGRMRVKNTDLTDAFTAHFTAVTGGLH